MMVQIRLAMLVVAFFLVVGAFWGDVYILTSIIFAGVYLSFKIAGDDISTPGVWLASSVWLYHYSLPILVRLGYYGPSYNEEIVWVPTIAIALIFISIAFFEKKRVIFFGALGGRIRFAKQVYILFLVLVAFYIIIYIFVFNGDKTSVALKGLSSLQICQAFFVVSYAGYLVHRVSVGGPVRNFILLNIAFSFFTSMATGERDIFAGVVIVTALCLTRYYRVGLVKVAFFAVSGGLLFTVLQTLRNFFTLNAAYSTLEHGIFVEFLAGEPRSAAQNFEILAGYVSSSGYLGWEFFVNDLLSVFLLKSMFSFENSLNWFNNHFFGSVVSAGGGVGYSLVANLYSYQGGVVVYAFFFTISILLIWLRRRSYTKNIYFAFYISCVPVMVYSLRGDISVLFGGVLRGIFPVFCMYYFAKSLTFGKDQ